MSSASSPKIGFLCGSLRQDSINKTLEKALIKRFKRSGAACTSINLETYDLPIFHGDLSLPTGVKKLTTKLRSCDGIVIISPEYNGGLPAVLKNAIDWVSTYNPAPFQDKYWGISSCTPGPMSGIMCMRQINYILTRMGAHVSPFQTGVGQASNAFDKKGELIAEPSASLAEKMIADMLRHCG